MTFGICSLGCKVNQYESEYIKSLFEKKGYIPLSFDKVCDIYIINTCTVTNNSDAKSRKMISHAKKMNKDACIVVCGCFVESAKDYKYDDVDVIIGNYNKSKVVELVETFFKEKKQINEKEKHRMLDDLPFEDMELTNYEDRTRAFVKIQDGCENYCSYCIIPFVRGKCRSKAKDKVIKEITDLVNNNYKEIVLTGIHTGNYGADLNIKFSELLKEILKIKGLKRLRISSIEITELDDEFFKLLENKIICNHMHVPLQSGSDKILKLMNRKYDTAFFLKQIEKLRKARNDISITTDVIVGFPEETDDDFENSCKFIEKTGFSKVHVFPYSKRNGTRAAAMKQVDGNIKKERVKKLIELSNKLEKKYEEEFINKTEEVLIEKTVDDYSYGHTTNYLYLKLPGKYNHNEIYDIIVKKEYLNSKGE